MIALGYFLDKVGTMKLLFYFILSLTLFGCGNFFRDKTNSSANIAGDGESVTKVTVDFSEVKQRIFEPHCVKCHSNYANFASVKQSISNILGSIEQNRMPKNAQPLGDDLKNLLRTWIAEGANENLMEDSQTEPTDEDPTVLKPTWTSLSLHVFEPKCLVCHSPVGKAPWIDFSNRATMAKTLIKHIDFKNPDDSNLVIRLRDSEEPMPPLPPQSTIPQLSEDEILVVVEWIKAGVP
jgi:cytochrome c5